MRPADDDDEDDDSTPDALSLLRDPAVEDDEVGMITPQVSMSWSGDASRGVAPETERGRARAVHDPVRLPRHACWRIR